MGLYQRDYSLRDYSEINYFLRKANKNLLQVFVSLKNF